MPQKIKIVGLILLIVVIAFMTLKTVNNKFAIQVVEGKTNYNTKNATTWQRFNMKVLKLRTKVGDHVAMVNLGSILFENNNFKDYQEAKLLWKASAKKGDSHAYFMLGLQSSIGYKGHESHNYKQSYKYFKQSAELGFKRSICIVEKSEGNYNNVPMAISKCL